MCQMHWKLLLKGNKKGEKSLLMPLTKDDAGLIHSMLIPNASPSFLLDCLQFINIIIASTDILWIKDL